MDDREIIFCLEYKHTLPITKILWPTDVLIIEELTY
jgi:hypothetical protein